jgi:hypothetical protein
MNMNAFRHSFDLFAGYAMPVFVDLAGYQLSGTLPFYNTEAGSGVRGQGVFADPCVYRQFQTA